MENGYWIVPTNTGATTSIDLKGEAVLISAPEGWTVTASIDNSNPTTLSVTPRIKMEWKVSLLCR